MANQKSIPTSPTGGYIALSLHQQSPQSASTTHIELCVYRGRTFWFKDADWVCIEIEMFLKNCVLICNTYASFTLHTRNVCPYLFDYLLRKWMHCLTCGKRNKPCKMLMRWNRNERNANLFIYQIPNRILSTISACTQPAKIFVPKFFFSRWLKHLLTPFSNSLLHLALLKERILWSKEMLRQYGPSDWVEACLIPYPNNTFSLWRLDGCAQCCLKSFNSNSAMKKLSKLSKLSVNIHRKQKKSQVCLTDGTPGKFSSHKIKNLNVSWYYWFIKFIWHYFKKNRRRKIVPYQVRFVNKFITNRSMKFILLSFCRTKTAAETTRLFIEISASQYQVTKNLWSQRIESPHLTLFVCSNFFVVFWLDRRFLSLICPVIHPTSMDSTKSMFTVCIGT